MNIRDVLKKPFHHYLLFVLQHLGAWSTPDLRSGTGNLLSGRAPRLGRQDADMEEPPEMGVSPDGRNASI